MQTPLIRIRDLSKRFHQKEILKKLNLDIYPGETLVILGKSGTGKSVLLKHIIGLSKADSGSIEIGDKSLANLSSSDLYQITIEMGMLFQGAALFDSMTVEENTGFFLRHHGDLKQKKPLSEEEITLRVKDALKRVGLIEALTKMPSELSGGMKKRAALARLIVYNPSIILYDEPTTGLDPITSMQINELIVKTQQELKATSVVVTHDILSALYVGDRLALMEDGVIIHIDRKDLFMNICHPTIEFLKTTVPKDAYMRKNIT
ncbi:ABC transporter ATP-binding protein [Rhabdochlamydiaceae symbiont of Dictyostelium giganteum]|uniref:ABC transporter ATP-binding protein n=1 Tax=Rhabdochlamydiaceae symbiont of Dictyostelium giganteum TaxID=3342349 RepID=UPI00384CA61C